jgi:superfamily II DNA/RNA helicase
MVNQVLDEADTMFDKGFGVEVRKFLGPLRNRSKQPGGDFQTILVTATITKVLIFSNVSGCKEYSKSCNNWSRIYAFVLITV